MQQRHHARSIPPRTYERAVPNGAYFVALSWRSGVAARSMAWGTGLERSVPPPDVGEVNQSAWSPSEYRFHGDDLILATMSNVANGSFTVALAYRVGCSGIIRKKGWWCDDINE